MEQQPIRFQGVKRARAGMPASDVTRHFDVAVRAAFKRMAAFSMVGRMRCSPEKVCIPRHPLTEGLYCFL